jgi:hypothetical protein
MSGALQAASSLFALLSDEFSYSLLVDGVQNRAKGKSNIQYM